MDLEIAPGKLAVAFVDPVYATRHALRNLLEDVLGRSAYWKVYSLKECTSYQLFLDVLLGWLPDAGYKATGDFLSDFAPLQRVKMAGDQLQQRLRAEYGPEQYFVPVLYALAKDIERRANAKNVRAAIMLPTGRPEPTRIVVYHYNMDGDSDVDLELPDEAGCSGQAWKSRAIAFADLEEAAQDPSPWGMTREQHAKVPSNRKSMICVPVHRELLPTEQTPPAPVATLGVDSTTPLDRTGWIDHTARGRVAHPDVVGIMMRWAYIIYRLLP